MRLVATIKLKVERNQELIEMSKTFLKAVQYAIDKGFENKVINRFELRRLVYRDLRQWLPADFACEAVIKAAASLKVTKLKIKRFMEDFYAENAPKHPMHSLLQDWDGGNIKINSRLCQYSASGPCSEYYCFSVRQWTSRQNLP